jgi:MYXO-CTERM domain-containing protein
MKSRKGVLFSLLLLATCAEGGDQKVDDVELARHGLGTVPASEVATWKKYGAGTVPDERYLQSVAFDETRKVLVMFGGMTGYWTTPGPTQDVWEWSPTTGAWTERVATGSKPQARSGAGWVFDSTRNKFILFGGRAGSGYDYQDTWEWDPATGTWTDRTGAGPVPPARCQAMLAFEKSKNLVLLFGGQRSVSSDPIDTSSAVSFGDTWEWDTTTGTWTARSIPSGPAGRFDGSLVWDNTRKKAVLFAGMQKESAGVAGVPKQDTWEWDPETAAWAERTVAGDKPSPRWGQAAAFDGSRAKLVVFGGWDINTNYYLNDVWDWDPTTGAWKQRFTGTESNLPSPRVYASLVSNDGAGRLELVAGMTVDSGGGTGGMGGYYGTDPYGGPYGTGVPGYVIGVPSRDVWELEPVAPAFSKRPDPLNSPGRRAQHAMAYCPDTGKTYVFGGVDDRHVVHDDLWEWDGAKWSLVASDAGPAARGDAALAYDPVRKSLILYGGNDSYSMYYKTYEDTWEWSPVSRKWSPLSPTTSPTTSYGHVMLTDMGRGKILLFGGMPGSRGLPYKPLQGAVWEWDGAKVTWTDRTSVGSSQSPGTQMYPVASYDESRQKLLVFPSANYYGPLPNNSAFWEWDAYSSGWSQRDSGDSLNPYNFALAAYDSSRRRTVLVTDGINPVSSSNAYETRELDSKGPTWYVRTPKSPPGPRYTAAMTYDSKRGVIVLYGGTSNSTGFATDETWEYSVTGLGKGSGCSNDFASACASGNCVDGVCCESASCTGPCQSCNVSGKEGSCIAAQAGTEVPGSCSAGQACDGSGVCKSKNGTACTSSGDCASGHCADGVCCNSDCKGTCESCNQAGRAGVCSPYVAGQDPEGECKKGSGPCASSCNGAGSCALPAFGSPCGDCMICDGAGTCMTGYFYDPRCLPPYGGTGGNPYTTRTTGVGGFGGTSWSTPRTSYGGSFGGTSSSGRSGGMSSAGSIAGSPVAGRSSSGGSIPFGGSAGSSIRSSTGGIVGGGGSFYSSTAGARGGSSSGGISSVGGSGGSPPIGGSGGSMVRSSGGSSTRDGGAGSSGIRDGGPDVSRGDAMSTTRLGSGGCSCSLGSAASHAPMALPLTVMAGLLLRRRRRG